MMTMVMNQKNLLCVAYPIYFVFLPQYSLYKKFSSVTIPPPIKETITHEGRILVHRVRVPENNGTIASAQVQLHRVYS